MAGIRPLSLSVALVLACGLVAPAAMSAEAIDIWTAAALGNTAAIEKHAAAGTDLDAREPRGGSTPLIVAALYGQTEAAGLLIEKGAGINIRNHDGTTALHAAAFLGSEATVALLLRKGADTDIRNSRGECALDTVLGPWNEDLERFYRELGELLNIRPDMDRLRAARPRIAGMLREATRRAEEKEPDIEPTGYRGAYFVNGEIHVNTYGTPEGRPLTTGHQDFKPSWSQTGDMLVFFRRLKDDPVVTNWKTAICVINVDGTGFHQLTDGTHTDFNQTWTRDGSNTPIWNRRNPETGGFYVMKSAVGNRPGQETALTGKGYHTWAYTCLKDGRILVQSVHPKQVHGYYLMTPADDGGDPRFERVACDLAGKGLLDRVSISPSESKVCFEYQRGFVYKDTGRTLYIADFDAERPHIANARPIANEEGTPDIWYAYPRWTRDESAIVYHRSERGRGALFLYTPADATTRQVSTNARADYRYPHCEAAPK